PNADHPRTHCPCVRSRAADHACQLTSRCVPCRTLRSNLKPLTSENAIPDAFIATSGPMNLKTTILDRQRVLRTLWPPTRLPFRMKPEYQPALVSVIIPTHNRAGLISRCLESVASQSYRPIELIIVDDGSTDSTADVVGDFSRRRRDGSFVVR